MPEFELDDVLGVRGTKSREAEVRKCAKEARFLHFVKESEQSRDVPGTRTVEANSLRMVHVRVYASMPYRISLLYE